MTRTTIQRRLARACALWPLLLAACGGGGSDPAPTPSPAPAPAPSPAPAPPPAPAAANVPGVYHLTPVIEGSTREFIVYVPEKARGTTAVPVVFMFHGTAQSGEQFFNISRWREVADAEGLIAVFPTALTYCHYDDDNRNGVPEPNEKVVVTKWAAGNLGTAKRPLCTQAEIDALPAGQRTLANHPLRDDVAFVDHMLEHLSANHAVDPKRIYASGFSNGAEMSGRLAAERANRFAAISCASSALSVDPVPLAKPISVIFSIGELDPSLGPLFGGPPLPLTESFITTNTAFRVGLVAPYLTLLQLNPTYTYSAPLVAGKKTSQFAFRSSAIGAGNSFQAIVIEGLGHEYPNGINHPVRMADALWQFFRTLSLP